MIGRTVPIDMGCTFPTAMAVLGSTGGPPIGIGRVGRHL